MNNSEKSHKTKKTLVYIENENVSNIESESSSPVSDIKTNQFYEETVENNHNIEIN